MDPTTAQERRWWNQLRCGDAEAGAEATFALSALLCDRGHEDEAEMILTDCARSNRDAIAAPAALRLARLIERRRGPAAAEPSYEQAAKRATPSASADVLIDLAERWGTQGETARARRAYAAAAMGSLQPRLRAVAFFRLGALDRDAGLLEEAIDAWEKGLADAGGALRFHLLIEIAEVLMDHEAGDRDRIEGHLNEVLDSDHPDLAPRAALRLAQVKRTGGQFIDAYRLTRMVVGSEHPVFAPEGEVECKRLLHGDLDSLLELDAPTPNQLALPGMVDTTCRSVNLYFSITSKDAHSECNDIGNPKDDDRCSMWRRNLSLMRQVELWSPHPDPCAGDRHVGGIALRMALVTRLDRNEISALRSAGDKTQFIGGHGCGCRNADFLTGWTHRRTALPCDRQDLEFLLLLRATGWLRSEALAPEPRVPPRRLRLIFERTTERLADLLAVDRRPYRDREAIWMMGMLDIRHGIGISGASEMGSASPPIGPPGHAGVEAIATALEAPPIEGAVTAVTV